MKDDKKDSVNCSRLFLEILQKETDEKKKDELLEAFVYQLVFNIERPRRDAQDYETGFWRRLLQKYGDKYPNILQAVKEYEEKTGGYTLHERSMLAFIVSNYEKYMDTRKPKLRSLFLKYLTDVLLAGLNTTGYIYALVWYEAMEYGFTPGELGNFPYKTLEDMPEKDRTAFEKTVEDVFSAVGLTASSYLLSEKIRYEKEHEDEDEEYKYSPYPDEGLSREELERYYQYKSTDELRGDGSYELQVFAPFVIAHFLQAMKLAIQYPGKEYEEYIQSLDGAEDFRTFWTQYGDERYENIYAKMLQFEEKDYGTGKDR